MMGKMHGIRCGKGPDGRSQPGHGFSKATRRGRAKPLNLCVGLPVSCLDHESILEAVWEKVREEGPEVSEWASQVAKDLEDALWILREDTGSDLGLEPTAFRPQTAWLSQKEEVATLRALGYLVPVAKGVGMMGVRSFPVKKKTPGEGRIILDCRPFNALIPVPPMCRVPYLHQVCQVLGKALYAAVFDYAGYFNQFRVPEWFAACMVLRGEGGDMTWTRLAMGCSWAPAVAQATSSSLMYLAGLGPNDGVTWIDDGLVVADSKDKLDAMLAQLALVWERFGVQLKGGRVKTFGPGTHGSVFDYLGMEVHLGVGQAGVATVQLPQAVVSEYTGFMDTLAHGMTKLTPKLLWGAAGRLLWAGTVIGRPLCLEPWLPQGLSDLAKALAGGEADWGKEISPRFRPAIVSWLSRCLRWWVAIRAVVRVCTCMATGPCGNDLHIVTDSSDYMAGSIVRAPGLWGDLQYVRQWRW